MVMPMTRNAAGLDLFLVSVWVYWHCPPRINVMFGRLDIRQAAQQLDSYCANPSGLVSYFFKRVVLAVAVVHLTA